MDKIYDYIPTFINYLFIISLIIFAYMRTTSLAGVDVDGKDIAKGLTKINLTSDIETVFIREKTSRFIIVGAVVLLFMTAVAYFFLDYDTETDVESVSNLTRLIFIWGSLFTIVYLINFIISRVTLSAEMLLRVFFITSLCFWLITGTTFIAISLLPTLVGIFENTVGYTWINTFSNAKEKMKIIKSRTSKSLEFPSEILITKFSLENFNDMFEGLMEKQHTENVAKKANEIVLDFFIDIVEGSSIGSQKRTEVKQTLLQLVKIKNKKSSIAC